MNTDSFFETEASNLRLDTIIPFDCFIRVEINGKFVHWLQENTVFTVAKKNKLEVLDVSRLWIMNIQRESFKKYMEVKLSPEDPNLIVLKGSSKESQFHILWGKRRNPPKTIILGLEEKERSEKESPPTPANLNVSAQFINIVIEAIVEVFSEQFMVSVTSKPPTRRTGAESPLQIDIASFIGLTSQTIRGTVALCFPSETYLNLVKQIIGLNITNLSPEYCVGSAEIMNSIFEVARPKLIDIGYYIDQAIPTFVVGQKLAISKIIPDRGFSIVFEAPGGLFQFEIGVKTGA